MDFQPQPNHEIAILVPTYPPRYLMALEFLDSARAMGIFSQADVYFVFTTDEERKGFVPCNAITLPKSVSSKVRGGGIINVKKFFGLMKLQRYYKYIINLDDDCRFIREVNLQQVVERFFDEKVLYGNLVRNQYEDTVKKIGDSCWMFFKDSTPRQPEYLWFNQIPVYKCSHLKDFFNRSRISKKLVSVKHSEFDHYVYMYYLMAYKGFEVRDLGVVTSLAVAEAFPGCYMKCHEFKLRDRIYMASEYAESIFNLNNVFIRLHIDRDRRKHSRILRKMRTLKFLTSFILNAFRKF